VYLIVSNKGLSFIFFCDSFEEFANVFFLLQNGQHGSNDWIWFDKGDSSVLPVRKAASCIVIEQGTHRCSKRNGRGKQLHIATLILTAKIFFSQDIKPSGD
jgi:hypothetical protein